MVSRFWQFCRHPGGVGALLIAFGMIIFYLPIGLGIARTDEIDLDYGDFVSIGAFVSTIVIAVFSIIPNLQSMAETSRSVHYSELDSMYLQILTMAVTEPHLRRPNGLDAFEVDQAQQYETYAFIVWNFIETIHDRCEKISELRATWAPAIDAEHRLHRDWFMRESTPYDSLAAPKFCLPFCDFIWRSFWLRPDDFEALPLEDRQRWMKADWGYRSVAEIRGDPKLAEFLYGKGTNAGSAPGTGTLPAAA
jgi:hypothetical protein